MSAIEKSKPDEIEIGGRFNVPIGINGHAGNFETYNPIRSKVPGRPEYNLYTLDCSQAEVAARLDEAIIAHRRAVTRGGTQEQELAALNEIRQIREWIIRAGERLTIELWTWSLGKGHNEAAQARESEKIDKSLRELGIDPTDSRDPFGKLKSSNNFGLDERS